MNLIDRRHFLLAGSGALLTACEKPLVSRTGAARYLAYNAKLLSLIEQTGDARDLTMAADLLDETNDYRARHDLDPLRDHPELARAAHAHIAHMQAEGFFEHDTPDGFSNGDRAGIICRSLLGAFGENLLFTEGRGKLRAARLVEMWSGSPGHKANLLRPDYTHAGHAVLHFGAKTYAATVFGQIVSSMTAPLPFSVAGADLGPALKGAQPRIVDYVVSEPASQPYREIFPVSGAGPKLLPGAWRLRPLRPKANQGLQILYGPIFVVS